MRIPHFSTQISPKINSDFPPTATVSTQSKKIPYICGLRAKIECEHGSEHSTHSDRVTNIGYLLSLGASFLPVATQKFILKLPGYSLLRLHQRLFQLR